MNEIQQNDVVVPATSGDQVRERIEQLEQSGFDLASYGDPAEQDVELNEGDASDLEVQVELTLEQITDQITDAMKLSDWTMYQIAKALNKVLEVVDIRETNKEGEEVAYRVRPQMVYNYNRNAMVARNEAGKGIVLTGSATTAQVTAFINRFVARKLSK